VPEGSIPLQKQLAAEAAKARVRVRRAGAGGKGRTLRSTPKVHSPSPPTLPFPREQELVLWLDCDREGEAIAFEVVDVCRAANPRLVLHRAWFSNTTAEALRHAFAHLIAPDPRLAEAVMARSELDLRLGAAFTRLQTTALGNQFAELVGMVLSYGPCQFPTLGFVVERFLANRNFVPEDFWELRLTMPAAAEPSGGPDGGGGGGGRGAGRGGAGDYEPADDDDEEEEERAEADGDGGGGGDVAGSGAGGGGGGGRRPRGSPSTRGRPRFSTGRAIGGSGRPGGGGGGAGGKGGGRPPDVVFSWERVRLYDHDLTTVFMERALDAGVATVVSVTGRDDVRMKPIPLNSVKFAILAARSLRMSSADAAKIAETLYSGGFISYPRTETGEAARVLTGCSSVACALPCGVDAQRSSTTASTRGPCAPCSSATTCMAPTRTVSGALPSLVLEPRHAPPTPPHRPVHAWSTVGGTTGRVRVVPTTRPTHPSTPCAPPSPHPSRCVPSQLVTSRVVVSCRNMCPPSPLPLRFHEPAEP